MIEQIRIQGLGVIADAVLEPHPGFTALTGETGAGKTMVLSGLDLLLGGQAETGLVRSTSTGQDGAGGRAEVEGVFVVPADGAAAVRVREAGGELDDGTLLVARTVSAQGRSRAYAGGRTVPAALLAQLAPDLVAVHSQSQQLRLLQPAAAREALDRYGGATVAEPYAAYRSAWDALRAVRSELASVVDSARERLREADLLRHGLQEIAAVEPVPGEDEALRAEAERLAHAEALRTAAATAHAQLNRDDAYASHPDVATLLGSARHALDGQRAYDPALARLADRAAELGALAADLATDLATYTAAVETDPARLAAVEERRAALLGLLRRYGDSLDEVLTWAETAAARLAELDGDDDRIAALQDEERTLCARLAEHGAALGAARAAAAERFGPAVSAELAALAMPHATLQVALRPREEPGPHGQEDVELLLTPHTGAEPGPLGVVASGGERSRLMLAIEVVLAGSQPVPAMVFDEVDAGIGGRAAVEVGRRLARLARTTQVLVVTHLPQVAAFADLQVVVEKAADGGVTRSGLHPVQGRDRVRELARMLAGLDESRTAAEHAKELLALAEQERAQPRASARRSTTRKMTTTRRTS